MKVINQGLFGVTLTATILSIASSASAFSIVFGNRDTENVRTNFNNSFNINSSSTVIDDGTNFGAAPNVGKNNPSVTRYGTVGSNNLTYTIYDIDFSDSPNGLIIPGTVGNDIDDLDFVDIESPVNQEGAKGIYGWGLDSGATGNGTSNAALFDFSDNPVGHFGIDLHDFEAGAGISSTNSTSGASGEIRLYQSGNLVHSHTLEFPGVDGGGSTDNPNNSDDDDSTYKGYGNKQSMFVGITANNPGEFFDQVAFVIGDDDVDTVGIPSKNNDGSTEKWAADGFTFGYAYKEVPFEFSPALGIFIVGGLWATHKLKRSKVLLSRSNQK